MLCVNPPLSFLRPQRSFYVAASPSFALLSATHSSVPRSQNTDMKIHQFEVYLLWNTQTRLRGGQFSVRFLARVRNLSLLKNVQTGSGAHPACQSRGAGVPSRRQSGRGVKLTTHLHLEPKLRMSGATPLVPLYAFTV
jgi:hypothetical protein